MLWPFSEGTKVPQSRARSSRTGRILLTAAAGGSLAVAGLHLGIVMAGAPAYAYFGAAQLVPLVERGSPLPALLTIGIALLVGLCGLYALAGAGRVRALPLLRPALAVITAVYLLRGVVIGPEVLAVAAHRPGLPPRELVFSTTALALGIVHAVGLRRAWPRLRPPRSAASTA
jgi:hypothetical protein